MFHSWWQKCDALPFARLAGICLATTLAWTGLLATLVVIQALDLTRLEIEYAAVDVLQSQLVIMLPWLVIFPAVALTRIWQILVVTPLRTALFELVVLCGAAIFLVYLHIVFVYAPYLQSRPADILDQLPLVNWVWDLVVIVVTALSADIYGRALADRLSHDDAKSDHIIIRHGNQDDILDIAEIFAVSAQGNYVAFIASEREWLQRATLSELVVQLAELDFIHVHRSHLVRASMIASCARERGRIVRVTLSSGHEFPVSARGAELLQHRLAQTALPASPRTLP